MITAAISAAVIAILALFGVTPTKSQIAVVVVVVKILVVLAGLLVAGKVRKRQEAARAAEKQPDPPSP